MNLPARLLPLAAASLLAGAGLAAPCPWTAGWMASQMSPDAANSLPADQLAGDTLRQVVRVTVAGGAVRVRFSNLFGHAPLAIAAAGVARALRPGTAAIDTASVEPLLFGGKPGVAIPPGAEWVSDPVRMAVRGSADLAVSMRLAAAPDGQTGHPGSRATSFLAAGDHLADADLPGAEPFVRWTFLSGVEVERCGPVDGIVALGDSITDGHGATTDGNDRWTDDLARALGGDRAVLNAGIGGGRVLLDGLGPNALARLDRDALDRPGVRHLIVLEGINDLGVLFRHRSPKAAEVRALVDGLEAAYRQIADRAHARGIKVHGGTIMPFTGSDYYAPGPDAEAARRSVNTWIRTSGVFDDVIDFDRAMRDPARPDTLDPRYDSGDHLHPSPAGYAAMAATIPRASFRD